MDFLPAIKNANHLVWLLPSLSNISTKTGLLLLCIHFECQGLLCRLSNMLSNSLSLPLYLSVSFSLFLSSYLSPSQSRSPSHPHHSFSLNAILPLYFIDHLKHLSFVLIHANPPPPSPPTTLYIIIISAYQSLPAACIINTLHGH